MNRNTTSLAPKPLTDWVGRTETTHGGIHGPMARMVRATLGSGPLSDEVGAICPNLWHWFAFPPTAGMEALGRDGHPARGGFLPPVPLERRMWAGGSLTFSAPIRLGDPLIKQSEITAVREKSGAAGDMVFVTVEHRITGSEGLCVCEQQDIVYLDIAPEFKSPPKRAVPDADYLVHFKVPLSPPLLFRYSAITFNSHRIHYDERFARDVEHYPALVVHGPLQANLLMNAATQWKGKAPAKFTFRGVHPMFCSGELSVIATAGESGALDLCTAVEGSHQGMQATAFWEDI